MVHTTQLPSSLQRSHYRYTLTHTRSHSLQHATIQTLLNTRSFINVKLHICTAQGNIRNTLFSSGVLFNFLLWSYFFPEPPCQLEKKVHIRHTLQTMEIFFCRRCGVCRVQRIDTSSTPQTPLQEPVEPSTPT